jgi:3-hydroxyisobutyrate dehydrogenase
MYAAYVCVPRTDRTAEKARGLVERGAKLAASPKEVAQQSDVVFTMVGFPHDGELTLFFYPLSLSLLLHSHQHARDDRNGLIECTRLFNDRCCAVRNVILGSAGVLEGLRSDGVVVDMTTSEPSLALEIYNEAKKKGVHSIDAPVSGSFPLAPLHCLPPLNVVLIGCRPPL